MLTAISILIGAMALQSQAAPLPALAPSPFLAGPQQSNAQPQPAGTASLDGIVVDSATVQPIAGAFVEMRKTECNNFGGAPEVVSVTTGNDGRFSFKTLRAGNWCLGAARAGGAYSPAEYGQHGFKGRGATIAIADNQQINNIRLTMAQTGSISGRVLDSDGEPMGHARVQALEAFYQDGERRLYALNVVQTNDLGEFSLFWLPPGQYYVSAVAEDPLRQQVMFSVAPPGIGGHRSDALPPVISRRNLENGGVVEEVYAPVYYGGGVDSRRAQPVNVSPGSNSSIDLSFAGARAPAFHIRGRVMNGVTGQPAAGAQLRLAPRDWSSVVVLPYANADSAGYFDMGGVTQGSYVLYATAASQDSAAADALRGLYANATATNQGGAVEYIAALSNLTAGIGIRIPLDMGSANLDNANLTLFPGYSLAGEFIFEGKTATDIPAQLRPSLRVTVARNPDIVGIPQPGTASAAIAAIAANAADNTFKFQTLAPGDYRVYVNPWLVPFQWGNSALSDALRSAYVKSIRFGNADVQADGLHLSAASPDARLQVVLASGNRLEGAVTNDRFDAMRNVRVVLVPNFALRRRWDLYRTTTTDELGKFRMEGIAPGDYSAFAWEDIQDGAWQDEEVLRGYEGRGKALRIGEGGQSNIDLTVIPARRPGEP